MESVPAIVATEATLVEVTVIGLALVRVRMPPLVTVGVAVPPLLSKPIPARVLLPVMVRTEPPRRVTELVGSICP